MSKNPIKLSATLLGMALVAFTSCEDQDFTDVNNDATRVEVNTISAEMAKVRDYVPPYAVMAHRGRNGIGLALGTRNGCGLPRIRPSVYEGRCYPCQSR